MTELAFFRAFLGWEVFLEESFILYLAGQKPSRGRAPYRYTFPPNQKTAMDWLVPEGRPYAPMSRRLAAPALGASSGAQCAASLRHLYLLNGLVERTLPPSWMV